MVRSHYILATLVAFCTIVWLILNFAVLPKVYYNKATEYKASGDSFNALVYYQAAGNYKDAATQASICRRNNIAADSTIIYVIKTDGSVLAPGKEIDNSAISKLENIVSISADSKNFYAIDAAGNVTFVGTNVFGEGRVSKWSDIIDVSSSLTHAVGVDKNGHVFYAGEIDKHDSSPTNWRDIVAAGTAYSVTIGLKADGRVVSSNKSMNVKHWSNIVAISVDERLVLGLKKNGTVVAATRYGLDDYKIEQAVKTWDNIIAISVKNNDCIGLKKDGIVVVAGENSKSYDVSNWKNIVAVRAGDDYIVGLKPDGTLIIERAPLSYKFDVSQLKDIRVS